MLVLSRRNGEMIVIQTSDGPITIRIEIHSLVAKLSFDAPQACRIRRAELKPEPATP